MSQESKTVETGSLANFQFGSNDDEWFGLPDGETSEDTSKVIAKVKDATKEAIEKPTNTTTTTTKQESKVIPSTETKEGTSDGDDDEVSFFEDEDEEVKPKSKETKVEPKETKTKEEVKDTKESGEDEEVDGDEEDEDFFTDLAKEFAEEGIFAELKLKDDEKLGKSKFFEKVDDIIYNKAFEIAEEVTANMDEDGKAFMRFKMDGGKTSDFLARYSSGLNMDELDTENDVQVDMVVMHYLTKVQGLSGTDLEDQLELLSTNGKKKARAEQYFQKIKDSEKKAKEDLIKQTNDAAKRKSETDKAFNNDLIAAIKATDKVKGLKLSKDEKPKLIKFLTHGTVEVANKKYIPGFQAQLVKVIKASTPEDRESLLAIAKILQDNFDFKDLDTAIETKVTNRVQSRLARDKKENRNSTSRKSAASLADKFGK